MKTFKRTISLPNKLFLANMKTAATLLKLMFKIKYFSSTGEDKS